ncbi:MAG: hypothetical protein ABT08_12405 [Microbacterium sp. SCN 71-21]|nr:MAG: hypothetical protein ABS80_01795 [Pseudonocardia sp. SCN 72-51]ODU72780.1 MAG: hypothetical protein ABT08_12405 [Microbacterium sp. SCN 71-21]
MFGPVLVVQTYAGVDDTIAVANDTAYGLAAGVFGVDPDRTESVAWRLRAGQVEINGGAFNPAAPFGGFGNSGHGREFGRWGIDDFLTTQAVQR